MTTLRQIIDIRQNKFEEDKRGTKVKFWLGYYEGWFWAYKDLLEILEQNGFDLDVVVIPSNPLPERTCETCYARDMDAHEIDNPCWNCKGDHSEWVAKEVVNG